MAVPESALERIADCNSPNWQLSCWLIRRQLARWSGRCLECGNCTVGQVNALRLAGRLRRSASLDSGTDERLPRPHTLSGDCDSHLKLRAVEGWGYLRVRHGGG
jgi:hypothetical protein